MTKTVSHLFKQSKLDLKIMYGMFSIICISGRNNKAERKLFRQGWINKEKEKEYLETEFYQRISYAYKRL